MRSILNPEVGNHIAAAVRRAGGFLLESLYPRRCPVCDEIVALGETLICTGCLKQISWVTGPACKACGREVSQERTEYCPDCMRRRHSFDRGMSLCNYNQITSRSMARIKYQGRREYLDFYGTAIAEQLGKGLAAFGAEWLVPVPIHPARERTRGFNQAQVLAERISSEMERLYKVKIPVENDLLYRRKKTLPQKDLNPEARLKNLEEAFEAGEISGDIRRVILVDDIYTTGSTADACAKVLKRAGVKEVLVVTICIGNQ